MNRRLSFSILSMLVVISPTFAMAASPILPNFRSEDSLQARRAIGNDRGGVAYVFFASLLEDALFESGPNS